MYGDFKFYKTEFHGTTIVDESSYKYYADIASEYIEQATFGRAKCCMEKVKKCECRIAEILAANHENLKEDEREVKSESLGGWSRTYAENKLSPEALTARIRDTIRLYLGMTGLLYCGIGVAGGRRP